MSFDLDALLSGGPLFSSVSGRCPLRFDHLGFDGPDLVGELSLGVGDDAWTEPVVLLRDAAGEDPERILDALWGWRAAHRVYTSRPDLDPRHPQQQLVPALLQLKRPRTVTDFAAAALRRLKWPTTPASGTVGRTRDAYLGSWAWTGALDGPPTDDALQSWLEEAMPFESADGGATLQLVELQRREQAWSAVTRLIGWDIDGERRTVRDIKEQPVYLGPFDTSAERMRSYVLAWELAMMIRWSFVPGRAIGLTMPADWAPWGVWKTKADHPQDLASAMLSRSRLGCPIRVSPDEVY